MNNKDAVVERVCKKCGDPLRSTNRYNYCDNCHRERVEMIRNIIEVIGGISGSTIIGLCVGKHFKNKK